MNNELQAKVDMDAIEFTRTKYIREDKVVVKYTPGIGCFKFNPKMVKLLVIENWSHVLIGHDPKSGIVILKECDVEEYGATAVQTLEAIMNKEQMRKSASRTRALESRMVRCKTFVKDTKLAMYKAYRAECNGRIVFLEGIEGSEITNGNGQQQ